MNKSMGGLGPAVGPPWIFTIGTGLRSSPGDTAQPQGLGTQAEAAPGVEVVSAT